MLRRRAAKENQLMKPIPVTASSILQFLLILATTTADSNYLLSCGAPSTVSTTPSIWDKRKWDTDNNSTFSNIFSSTTAASTTITDRNEYQIPFSTARIFTGNFTYSFPVSPGPKFIRLYFYPSPSPYSSSSPSRSYPTKDAYLTVQTNSGHLLLRNFSAYLSVNPPSDIVTKEFYVHVSDVRLQLTFLPTQPSSHAFVNGIEVVSVPENLYVDSLNTPVYVDEKPIPYYFLGVSSALETAYRLNVGGSSVSLSGDSGSMSRHWSEDAQYLIGNFHGEEGYEKYATQIKYTPKTPSYSAPAEVYQTMRWMGPTISDDLRRRVNVTWGFTVDLGFNYLVRLHWCEISIAVNTTNYRVFDVYLDEMLADKAVDIYWLAPGSNTATYRDYVVHMDASRGDGIKGELLLAMHPDYDAPHGYHDILLNGLEIFKINKSNGNLDGPNPSRPLPTTPLTVPKPNSTTSHVLPAIIGAIAGSIILSGILCYVILFRRRSWSKMSDGSSGTASSKSKGLLSSSKSAGTTHRSSGGSYLPSHLCRYFSLADIRIATSDFSDSLIVGHGGFGNVYKGTINSDTGPINVAIKRLNPLSGQGAREFTTEIELLSKLRHLHLVSLIGYCDDCGEMILVYEFMSHGTLRDHLYPHNTDPNTQLSWYKRLEICVGAARGLHYLHTGTERMIIHRDVKSTNILLDGKWVAKVSDFGLSKLGPTGGEFSHVSTAVKGSFGYVDPEYYRRQQLTEKSDVYSFGVVLFEVLCGRTAVNPNLPKEQVNLRIWARRNQMSGTLELIVDPTLRGQIAPECLRKFGEVAESCVRDEGAQRPSMADVIWGLEFALQLQLEAAAQSTVNGDDSTVDEEVVTTNITSPTNDTTVRLIKSSGVNTWNSMNDTSSGLFSSTSSVGYGGGSTDVFSQIFKPEGR